MKLATQIFLGFLIAISIDLMDSFVNFTLTLRVKTISDFLNRSELVIRYSGALNKEMVEMQSAFRGYLLTGDDVFLQSYLQKEKEIPVSEGQLRRMFSIPGQTSMLDSIMRLHESWLVYADELVESRKKLGSGIRTAERFDGLLDSRMRKGVGREYNRQISQLLSRLDSTEYSQRDLRREELQAAIRRTDRYSLLFSIVLLIVGIGIALFLVRKISRRIGSLVRLAERISVGDFGQIYDDKKDELSSLSVSLNRMSEKLSQSIAELEKKNAELNQFAYVVSHDLKAPVRGISNVVRWIEEDHASEIGPNVRKYLDFIPERIMRMEGLIDGLLEYARAGGRGAAKESLDVEVMIGELVDLIVPEGYIVRTGKLPLIYTERLPLQQVFSNLIGNAVKYGAAGDAIISVGGVEYDSYYEFWVEDNGPGIKPEYHERIFGLFQTLREKEDKQSTGIGLSIVRKILVDRGGTIRVVSSPGNGAKFIFTWPKEM